MLGQPAEVASATIADILDVTLEDIFGCVDSVGWSACREFFSKLNGRMVLAEGQNFRRFQSRLQTVAKDCLTCFLYIWPVECKFHSLIDVFVVNELPSSWKISLYEVN
ncbi:hypothetical protein RvY_12584 [Ramazzottius varieornatus]|uniref:Uncharacterized protein n=1 Tax=Ramazzottius varieornatus TaxID=947166 RepID=A0A1D1VTR5_RAMVA|nr:hypothetical protein RvY_12584 [Ramazzottius varieornatus]